MKLQFEEWILSQKIGDSAKDLFDEAITCYKASAYRASLLLSYLGFQTVVRDRIIISKCPTGFPEIKWRTIQRDVTDENKWDSAVFDAIQTQSPASIFPLTDDLRNQVTFWRNRRNDCAHSKRNEIGFAHVEAFWLFIKSTLGKFVVAGTKEELTNQIAKHFDRRLTPPGEDFTQIIEEIRYIESEELSDFFEKANAAFEALAQFSPATYPSDTERFFGKIFSLEDNSISSKLCDFLLKNQDLLLGVLELYPNRLTYFTRDTSFVRNLWYEKLFSSGRNSLALYCSLLRNNLIPQNQIDEANETVIQRYKDEIPDEDCFQILKSNGFFETFKEIAFAKTLIRNFSWANANSNFIVFFLERFEIDASIATAICKTFSSEHNPIKLEPALNKFFGQNQLKKKKFLEIVNEENLELPRYLKVFNKE